MLVALGVRNCAVAREFVSSVAASPYQQFMSIGAEVYRRDKGWNDVQRLWDHHACAEVAIVVLEAYVQHCFEFPMCRSNISGISLSIMHVPIDCLNCVNV